MKHCRGCSCHQGRRECQDDCPEMDGDDWLSVTVVLLISFTLLAYLAYR